MQEAPIDIREVIGIEVEAIAVSVVICEGLCMIEKTISSNLHIKLFERAITSHS